MPSLIGTGPNQIPTNNLLGSLAFQDAENVKVENANAVNISTTDLTSSGNTDLTNISYSGTMTGGTGVINIGAGQIYKDASGNVGIGTVPSSWSNYKALQIGAYANIAYEGGSSIFGTNAYYNGSAWTYQSTNRALDYYQDIGSGSHVWRSAASGTDGTTISWSNAMELNSNRDLLLSGTGATKVQEGTTAQRPSTPQEGMIRKNSTLGVIEGYSGGGYVSLEAGRLIARTRFTSDGTFIPDTKTKMLIVELVSGGGGSGGCSATAAGQVAVGGPGDPGRFARFCLPRGAAIAASWTVTVGVGGVAGASGANAGGSGGFTSLSGGGSNVAYVSGGDGGTGGVAVSSFPVIKTNPYNNHPSNTVGAFQVWEEKSPPKSLFVIYDSVSKVSSYSSSTPFASRPQDNANNGTGGWPPISWASQSAQAGSPGSAGEVIIYEYS